MTLNLVILVLVKIINLNLNLKIFIQSTYAYSVKNHRHIAEIDQEFKKISKKLYIHLILT